MTTQPITPPRLAPGDTVALISPASPPRNRRLLLLGRKRLEQLGLSVVPGKHVLSEYGYLAGSDRDRLRDLEAAFRDPRVKAIFCARGGYGVSRLLAGFDPALATRHPKALIGFSDITVLHLAMQKAGVVSFWGPMPCTGLGWTPFSVRSLERALMSGSPVGRVPFSSRRRSRTLRPGIAQGPLTGGTLSLVAASLGTSYEVDTRGRIVFFEDVDEEPYRVDRLLAQLIAAGKLADAAGVALGIFTGTKVRNSPGRLSLTMQEVFADHLLPLKIPILANLAVGHVPDQVTLPYGIEARLDAAARTLEVLEPGVA
ncbi:MAG TPA: LD-carboxypeptidase [Vicinamibacterales bacterium]|nr:LD-carboxypeptidase [Vicinamibacterales bacterium]